MKPIIKVESLAKQYRIGKPEAAYGTLRESIVDLAWAPVRRLRNRNGNAANQMIWALKDVSFEVNRGEVVGIIGQNGAGKSTLLKVLSRIVEPTRGMVELYGRVASLLEVGTGFHPELTGRENIFLNGAILGMKKAETERNFDEIVAFAEVEKFIDTPVKRYSTGMYLRLAFAVAAHLEPEILIVDEVLAVGDVNFQRKCLDKMETVARQGRTVLFVSHNMPAITRLCPRVILLREGRVAMDSDCRKVSAAYLDTGLRTTATHEWPIVEEAPGDDRVRVRAVRVRGGDGRVTDVLDVRERISIEIEYDVLKPGKRLSGGIILNNEQGVCAFSSADFYPESIYKQDTSFTGRRVTSCEIPANLMTEGAFSVSVAVYALLEGIQAHAYTPNVVGFTVFDPIEGDSARGMYTGPVAGVVRPRLEWKTAP